MKKVICKVEYDTEASEFISKHVFGEFGDPAGYEECLFKTEGGKFFLYTHGGAESKYPERRSLAERGKIIVSDASKPAFIKTQAFFFIDRKPKKDYA